MKTKEYKEVLISYNLAVSEKDISELNNWLEEIGVKIEVSKDDKRTAIRVFKDYKKYKPEDEEFHGV